MHRKHSQLRDIESDEDESDTELLVPGGNKRVSNNEMRLADLQEIFSSSLVTTSALENRMKQNARYGEDYADIQ